MSRRAATGIPIFPWAKGCGAACLVLAACQSSPDGNARNAAASGAGALSGATDGFGGRAAAPGGSGRTGMAGSAAAGAAAVAGATGAGIGTGGGSGSNGASGATAMSAGGKASTAGTSGADPAAAGREANADAGENAAGSGGVSTTPGRGGASGDAGGTSGGASLGGAGSAGTSSSGSSGMAGAAAGMPGSAGASSGTTKLSYVFVIPLENHDPGQVIGNTDDAPYLNDTLVDGYASASNFVDQFALSTPSEPHYVWMEAGTNEFSDHTFTGDGSPSASNSTADTDHLVTQMEAADSGLTWRSYQEGIDSTTGACPIASSGHYHPRHNPFVFFQDVSGDPPSKTNTYCAEHHKPLTDLAGDLSAGAVARYNFVTPDLCHDMHGQTGCPDSNLVRSGDQWLAANVPPIIDFVNTHGGVIFFVWDEGDETRTMPFIAVGPGVKAGYVGDVEYNHGSLLKSLQEIFGLPVTSRVAAENDLADLFQPGEFP